MTDRKRRGNLGEDVVANELTRRGYQVLERQYRCRWGEIDIIAISPEGVLCFIEVKTRSGGGFAQARESVTGAKQRKLRNAAACYLSEKGLDSPCRFDVAEVYCGQNSGKLSINYFRNAF